MAARDTEVQDHLSSQQLTVLRQAAQGLSTDEIAAALGLKPLQVQQALLGSLRQLGARTKLEAILYATELGLIELEPQIDGER